jgi:hypothetical protein
MVEAIIKQEAALNAEQSVQEIETLFRKHIKSKTLTDDAYSYMGKLVREDAPKNATELF